MKDFLQGRASFAPLTSTTPDRDANSGSLPVLGAVSAPGAQRRSDLPSERCEAGAPHVEFVESNGRIEQIIVTCGCGERITLQCAY